MMLVTNGIDSFETLYRKYIHKFMKRVEYSCNVIINRMTVWKLFSPRRSHAQYIAEMSLHIHGLIM